MPRRLDRGPLRPKRLWHSARNDASHRGRYSGANIVKSIEQSRSNAAKQVWANQSEKSLYIHLVDDGKLLLTNCFNIKKPTDTLYYVGSIYEQFGLSTKSTELYFSGEKDHFNLLKKHISLTNNISDLCAL